MPYLLRSHLHSCNLAVEIFAVILSCEGEFPVERYMWPSLQGVQERYQSPSEDKMERKKKKLG